MEPTWAGDRHALPSSARACWMLCRGGHSSRGGELSGIWTSQLRRADGQVCHHRRVGRVATVQSQVGAPIPSTRRQWPEIIPLLFFMALNDHPQSVPVAICRAKALVMLRALPCGSITCRGRAEQVAVYLVVEETGASVLPASLVTLYAQHHVESYLAIIAESTCDHRGIELDDLLSVKRIGPPWPTRWAARELRRLRRAARSLRGSRRLSRDHLRAAAGCGVLFVTILVPGLAGVRSSLLSFVIGAAGGVLALPLLHDALPRLYRAHTVVFDEGTRVVLVVDEGALHLGLVKA